MTPIASLPRMLVEVDDAPLSPGDARALTELRVHQRLSAPTLCELTLVDASDLLSGRSSLVPGASMQVAVEGWDVPLFEGEVAAFEYSYEPSGGRRVQVRGYDRLYRLRKRQHVRAYVQMTLSELVSELVADLGLSVGAADSSPLWQRLVQYRQSDLEFLTEVAQRCGLHFALRGKTVYLMTLEGLGSPVSLSLGESLLEVCFEMNAEHACRAVSASGWDPMRVEQHRGIASTARVGRTVSASAPELLSGRSGERILVDETVRDDRQIEAIAQAELDFRVARELTLRGVTEGNPELRPGASIDVTGVAPALAGRYVLTAVNHVVDDRRGFTSEISTAPPVSATRPPGAVAALGIVTRVDDPENLGRVQVLLPTYENVETDWMGVLTAGAGSGKGIVALPDTGDQVLVLFPHGDPAHGVVLGGLYGVNGPPDGGVEEREVRRYTFLTPGGQRVRLDDSRKSVRLENAAGSYLDLSPEKVLLHAGIGLEIEAPGQTVTIRGHSINFERG
jgi:phage protein D/phage baseplate assembly protein gpV